MPWKRRECAKKQKLFIVHVKALGLPLSNISWGRGSETFAKKNTFSRGTKLKKSQKTLFFCPFYSEKVRYPDHKKKHDDIICEQFLRNWTDRVCDYIVFCFFSLQCRLPTRVTSITRMALHRMGIPTLDTLIIMATSISVVITGFWTSFFNLWQMKRGIDSQVLTKSTCF